MRDAGDATVARAPHAVTPTPAVWPAALISALAAALLVLLLAYRAALPGAPWWGLALTLIAACALACAAACAKAPAGAPVTVLSWKILASGLQRETWASSKWVWLRWGTTPLGASLLALLALGVGVSVGGWRVLPLTLTAALLLLLPAAWRRPGWLLFVLVGLLYLPNYGSYGLWDPWETHYGEVAREILARHDWISLWWAQDGFFWSKPILIFWLEAWCLQAFGVPHHAGQFPAHAEWALRLPSVLFALLALLCSYAALKRVFGARMAWLAGVILATCPLFYCMAHQAITDMPYVATLTMAMAALVWALSVDPDSIQRHYRVARWTFAPRHVALVLFTCIVLPQLSYLLSRNFSLLPDGQLLAHADSYSGGSPGNDQLPGNKESFSGVLWARHLWLQPAMQALYGAAAASVVVWRLLRETRLQPVCMTFFYIACGLSFMAKGLPGCLLAGLSVLLYLLTSGQWQRLLTGQFRVAWGVLVTAVCGAPWFVAMTCRHGPPFLNRLLIHDHVKRLATGVHGDQGDIAYFLEQLAYAAFPWSALIVGALGLVLSGLMRARPAHALQRDVLRLYAAWCLGSFTLFSAMVTKFHHYILPVVPPAAVLVAHVIDRAWVLPSARKQAQAPQSRWRRYFAGSLRHRLPRDFVFWLTGALFLAFIGRDLSWVTAVKPPGQARLIHL
ncbi:MAG: ArnT family glycosyltransferase, partial [Polyangiales bacterium]